MEPEPALGFRGGDGTVFAEKLLARIVWHEKKRYWIIFCINHSNVICTALFHASNLLWKYLPPSNKLDRIMQESLGLFCLFSFLVVLL